ncbi:Methylamine utilisation protein MauE [Thermomonospora echinospora]|uniref:Methylamine utilisation protein MauE n=1 Tax=Thermomonospora echinospora TaxID=1992 RepID=A0A1H6CVX6_9ACTN|nr:MauE/DoxX family redox-associated membrane protein [Thermomonospora echinospora]SEG76998.1 Methylamine utilisation protein MauE [Thermomonospora echinospora]
MIDPAVDAQVLLLAMVLAGAGLAKLLVREPVPVRPPPVHGVPEPPAATGWAVTLRRSRPVAAGLGLAEVTLGAGLMLCPYPAVRAAAATLLAAATWVVAELRQRTPDAGCGCFGGLSDERVGLRDIARTALLAAAAFATLGATDTGVQIARTGPWQVWALCGLELALLAALSPEPAALLRRRQRPTVPCERRRSPLTETYATLRRSDPWRRHRHMLDGGDPLDVWREGCWRFLAYSAHQNGHQVEVVFAVSTAHRNRTVRAAVLPTEPPIHPNATHAESPAIEDTEESGPHYIMSG